MPNKIEIYVRVTSEPMLHIFLPTRIRRLIQDSFEKIKAALSGCETHIEVSILPEWITDQGLREKFIARDENLHVRIPIRYLDISGVGMTSS